MAHSSTTAVVNQISRRRSKSSSAKSALSDERVWFGAIALIAVTLIVACLFSWKKSRSAAVRVAPVELRPEKSGAGNSSVRQRAGEKEPRITSAPVLSLELIRRATEGIRAIPDPVIETPDEESYPRAPLSGLELQVELSRRGFSSGAIDGIAGGQTVSAIQAFQTSNGLPVSGSLDAETLSHLQLQSPALGTRKISGNDLARLQPLSSSWLGKSQQTALDYETPLELVAERFHAHPNLIRKLNPAIDWSEVVTGTEITVPLADAPRNHVKAAHVQVRLADHVLEAFDGEGRILAHFPVSIARNVEKRPVGELHVTVVIPNPNYTFNPDVFPESAEAAQLGRNLILPPGPNNPVGVAWIGLDRPGYGMHGTPAPEQVGRTESHGCFRLANWDALTLLDLAWVGLPVMVDP